MAGVRRFDEAETLRRALDVFGERGFRATSMIDLAVGTGVQRGSLYHAYGGKEEIFLLVFARYAEQFLAGADEALDRPGARAALLAFFDFCVDTITRGEPSRGCLSTRTAIDAATESPRVGAALRRMLDDLESVVRHRLAAVDAAELAVDPAAAARLVVTTTRGLAVMERLRHTPAELRDIARALVESLVR
jgi:AcrR family transcriptional regulator